MMTTLRRLRPSSPSQVLLCRWPSAWTKRLLRRYSPASSASLRNTTRSWYSGSSRSLVNQPDRWHGQAAGGDAGLGVGGQPTDEDDAVDGGASAPAL